LALSLLVRLAIALTAPRTLVLSDARFWESIGYRLATEHTFTDQTIYAPGYLALIGGVYSVTGRNLLALRLVEATISTGTVALVGGLGSAIFGPAAGLVAAALAAFHPVMLVLPVIQYAENLLMLLTALAFGSFVFAMRRPSAWRWTLAGMAFGLAMLTKPIMGAALPGLAIGAMVQARRARMPWLRPAALFALALTLTLVPWTVRNYRIHHCWFLVSTQGGTSFWAGNNLLATGASDVPPVVPQRLQERLDRCPDRVQKERVLYAEGWRFVREQPLRALRLYFVKMGALWSLFPQTSTHTVYTRRLGNLAQGMLSLLLFGGALIGLARLRPHGVPYLPLAVLSFTLVNSAFFMVMRYRMSFEVILLWLAGVGYAAVFDLQRRDAAARARSRPDPGVGTEPAR
jgi:4-amino-4-deoxy-L-arabinose transferase-like glycosyltransferase